MLSSFTNEKLPTTKNPPRTPIIFILIQLQITLKWSRGVFTEGYVSTKIKKMKRRLHSLQH